MPSLFRFFYIVVILAAISAGTVFALANFVEPSQRDLIIFIPAKKLNPS